MRYLLIVCCLYIPFAVFSQKMLRSGEWCAEGKMSLALHPPLAPDNRSDSIDITHIAIAMNVASPPQIAASSRIFFTPKMTGVPEIRLDLEGLIVDSVSLDGVAVPFSRTSNSLKIAFPAPLAPGAVYQLKIDYHGTPVTDASNWGGVYYQSNYFFNLGVGFAADPHSFGRAWFPCFDNFVERSTYECIVTSLKSRPAYCNGLLTNEIEQKQGTVTRHWAIEQPIPSYLVCFASGPYTSWKRNFDSIPVEIAAAAADTNKVAATFKNLPQAIQCFKHWYGPYQWPKIGYSLVPFNSGAMEHATNIAIGRTYIDGSLTYESLWAHELSHHWWGDLATCSTAEDMWLNEGWAVFSEHLLTEWLHGPQAYRDAVRDNFLPVLERAHVNEGGYRAVSGIPHALTYGTHVYNKGAVVAHNLRGYLGDSLFRVGIRAALEQTSFDDWSSAEFRDKLSAATGRDLTDFFDDWVFGPGFTHFSIDSLQVETPAIDTYKVVRVFVKQKLRGAPHFYQNVPLEFTFVDQNWQRQTRTTVVGGESTVTVFHLPLTFEPKFVWVNTNLQLTLARADREMVVKTTGSKSFSPAKISLNITSLPDSALIRTEYHYVAPDKAGNANPNGYSLTNRYWTVEADLPAGFDAAADIVYDGRGILDQLDVELFAQTSPNEDSVLLLYRPAPGVPWTEYPTYSKNKLTSSTDKYGFIRIFHIQPGQYTIGKGVSTVGTHEATAGPLFATAIPNPASSTVRLKAEVPFDRILMFNEKGQTIRERTVPLATQAEIPVTGLPDGRYWIVLFTEKGAASCSVIVVAK